MSKIASINRVSHLNHACIKEANSLRMLNVIIDDLEAYLNEQPVKDRFQEGEDIYETWFDFTVEEDELDDHGVFEFFIGATYTRHNLQITQNTCYKYFNSDLPEGMGIELFEECKDIFSRQSVCTDDNMDKSSKPLMIGFVFIVIASLMRNGYSIPDYTFHEETGLFSLAAYGHENIITVEIYVRRLLADYYDTYGGGHVL